MLNVLDSSETKKKQKIIEGGRPMLTLQHIHIMNIKNCFFCEEFMNQDKNTIFIEKTIKCVCALESKEMKKTM